MSQPGRPGLELRPGNAADVLLDNPQEKVIRSKMSMALTQKVHLIRTAPALRPPGSRQGARTLQQQERHGWLLAIADVGVERRTMTLLQEL